MTTQCCICIYRMTKQGDVMKVRHGDEGFCVQVDEINSAFQDSHRLGDNLSKNSFAHAGITSTAR